MPDILIHNPKNERAAPNYVGRTIVNHLVKKANQVNGKIKIFNGVKDIYKLKDSSVVHLTTSPLIFPNSKFLLHFLSKITKKKLILNLHGDALTEAGYRFRAASLLDYMYHPKIISAADRVIVNSYKMSELLRSKYNVENDVVIPNGIEDWWFKKSDIDLELKGDPVIFHHGRLWAEKGVYQLIKGFSNGTKDHKSAKLYIAGSGPQERFLRKLCADMGVKEKVEFLGFCKRDELKAYLANSDIAIYPSLYEPFSLAILEALTACNCPVLYSKSVGIDDFVRASGRRFNTFYPTVEEISNLMKDVVEGVYSNYNFNGQKVFSRDFTWQKVIESYVGLYNELLEN